MFYRELSRSLRTKKIILRRQRVPMEEPRLPALISWEYETAVGGISMFLLICLSRLSFDSKAAK
jgi:hypothetical protein